MGHKHNQNIYKNATVGTLIEASQDLSIARNNLVFECHLMAKAIQGAFKLCELDSYKNGTFSYENGRIALDSYTGFCFLDNPTPDSAERFAILIENGLLEQIVTALKLWQKDTNRLFKVVYNANNILG